MCCWFLPARSLAPRGRTACLRDEVIALIDRLGCGDDSMDAMAQVVDLDMLVASYRAAGSRVNDVEHTFVVQHEWVGQAHLLELAGLAALPSSNGQRDSRAELASC